MYELFLVAEVAEKDLQKARDVLGGYCSQDGGWESLYHVHQFAGPARPTGMTNVAPTSTPIQKEVQALWKELDQACRKQSYHIQARYEVKRSDFTGAAARATDHNALPGILRWIDFPDPPIAVGGEEKGLITQHKKIEIWGQKNLPAVVKGNKYQFAHDHFEHNYLFTNRDDMEFKLWKVYFPRDPSLQVPGVQHEPITRGLPAWSSLIPVYPDGRWILYVSVFVLEDDKPEELRKAQDRLVAVKREFEGVFDFKIIDRKVFDTRVPLEQKNAPAPLPQVVRAND